MVSKICRQWCIAKQSILASVLMILAIAICAPQVAFAKDSSQVIDGAMTISLQSGAGGGGASGGSGGGAGGIVASSTTSASGGISSGVLTGDTLIWLILGIVVLLAGAVYVLVKSKRLVGACASLGSSAEAMIGSRAGSPAVDLTSSRHKIIIVAVITALVACACFGMFASKSNAFAKEVLVGVAGTSNVVVDEQGNVISNDLVIANNSSEEIFINNVQAPDELKGWNASIKDATVESGSFVQGSWDGKTIPASLLNQVKNNSKSSIELALKINITKALDFNAFTFDTEGLVYSGGQITPQVASDVYKQGTDYEVVYGENKNAGEGTITIKGIGNYKGEQTFTFTIEQKELALKWDDQASFTYEYDGKSHVPSATISGGTIEGDTVNLTVEGAQTNASDTPYIATAKIDNANYKLPNDPTQSFTINQREVMLTWSADSFTYNGQVQGPTATAGNLVEGDVVTVTVEGADVNAGTYIAKATALDNLNYKLPTEVEHGFTINQREVTLAWSEDVFTYNGQTQAPTATAGNLVGSDMVNIAVTGAQINASDTPYTATATELDNANYNLPSANIKDFTILKALVKVSGITAKNKPYDGNTKADLDCSKAIFEGKFDKDVLTVSAEGAFKDATIGTDKEITISNLVLGGDSVGNYELASTEQQTSTTASITQASLNFDKISVDTKNVEYAGKQIKPEVTSSDYAKGTDFEVTYGENKNVGEGTITVKGIGNYAGEKSYTFNITQKEITLSWSGNTFTYNGQAQGPTATAGNVVEGDKVTVTVEGAQTNASDTPYTATALIDNTNYQLPKEHTQSFTITQREVTLSWSEDVLTYNSQVQAPVATVDNLAGDDKVTVTVEGANVNAGTYIAKATVLDNLNYKLPTDVEHGFTINQREVSLTWSEDSLTYNGQAQAPTATAGNLVGDDGVTITVVGAQTNASETPYTATATELDNANYKLPSANTKEFSIAKVPVKVSGITANNKVYDGNTKADLDCSKAIFEGKLDKDTLTVSAEGAFKDATIGTDKEVTVSNLVLGGDSVGNYELASTEQQTSTTASITQASLNFDKISVDTKNVEYAGKQIKPEVASSDYAKGTDFEVTYGENKNVGEGTITVKGIGNYAGKKLYTFTINQKELALTWDGQAPYTYQYNGQPHAPSAKVTGVLEGDTVDVTVKGAQINASDTPYTATAKINNANYKLPVDCKIEFTITRAEITVSGITAKNKEYDRTNTAEFDCSKATLAGKIKNDELSVSAQGAFEQVNAKTGINVTITKLALTGASKDNYILAESGQQTTSSADITPRVAKIAWSDTSISYVSVARLPQASVENIVQGDWVEVTVATEDGKDAINVGSYKAIPTALSDSNYVLPQNIQPQSFTIEKALLLILGNVSASPKEYDGTTTAEVDISQITVNGVLRNDDVKVSGASGTFDTSDVGEDKTVTINYALSGEDSANYEVNTTTSITTTTASIAPASLDPEKITVSSEGATYTGKQLTPKVSIEGLKEGHDYSVVYGENINAGTNAGVVFVKGMGNYTGSCEKHFVIAKANPQIEYPQDLTAEEGQKLSDIVIPKQTTPVKGTFTWNDPSGDVGAVGDHAFFAKFTPEDTNNYNIVENVGLIVEVTQKKTAFAVYFAEDSSLCFYNRAETPKANDTLDEKTVTAVYTGIETINYKDSSAPWQAQTIEKATVVDYGIQPTSTAKWFVIGDGTKLTSVDVAKLDISKTTDMTGMFENCKALTSLSDISAWDTTNVEHMANMFNGCSSLTQDCSNWNVDKVGNDHAGFNTNAPNVVSPWDPKVSFAVYSETDRSLNFYRDTKLPTEGGTYKNKAVTKVFTNFEDTSSSAIPWSDYRRAIESISVEDTGIAPVSTAYWFRDFVQLKSANLSKLDTSNVTDTSYMFYRASLLQTLDLSSFDTARVTSMAGMFDSCSSLTSIEGLLNWDTGNVTDMSHMFSECIELESVSLSNFNTSKVTNMRYLFLNCTFTSLNLTNWDVSHVEDMTGMFDRCKSLAYVGDISNWDTGNVANMTATFRSCSVLSADCSGWSIDKVANDSHADFNASAPGVKSPWDNPAFAVYSDDGCLYFYKGKSVPAPGSIYRGITVKAVFEGVENTSSDYNSIPWAGYRSSITSVKVVDYGISPACMAYWFSDCSNLATLEVSRLEVSNVTSMLATFNCCSSLRTLDISAWNTSSVENMAYMFAGSGLSYASDLSSLNTAKVKTMTHMFDESKLESVSNLTSWNTSNVEDMSYMFNECRSLTWANVSTFDTSAVTDMSHMFYHCPIMKTITNGSESPLDWTVENVLDMSYMFAECEELAVDCSGWEVHKEVNHEKFTNNNTSMDVKAPKWR